MKMKRVFEYVAAAAASAPGDDGIPNHHEMIHDHLADRYDGRIYRGEGQDVEFPSVLPGHTYNMKLRSARSTPTTTMFTNRRMPHIRRYLAKNGWTERNSFDEEHEHPQNDHIISFSDGWRGMTEMQVRKK